MKMIGANRSSITGHMESCQVSRDAKQRSNGEPHVFLIIRGPYINALFWVSGRNAWIMKKESTVHDCIDFARTCGACQLHANFIHRPLKPLHPTVASWPFEAWSLYVVGPFTLKSSTGQMYVLAAIDYFSKMGNSNCLKGSKK